MKDMAKAWAEYYASFKPHSRLDEEIEQPEEDEEDSESLIEVEICTTPEPREKKPRETKAQKVKRLMEELLFRRAYEAEIKRRATTISKVDANQYTLQPNTIEHLLYQSLSANPKHITDIITDIEALGWKSNSKYHKYAQVHKALRSNIYMFVRVGSATFKLRNGFNGAHIEKPAPKEQANKDSENIPTITDIAIDITKRYQETNGIYPGRVHQIMNEIGYRCSYSGVYRAMQSKPFVKEGFWYRLDDHLRAVSNG